MGITILIYMLYEISNTYFCMVLLSLTFYISKYAHVQIHSEVTCLNFEGNAKRKMLSLMPDLKYSLSINTYNLGKNQVDNTMVILEDIIVVRLHEASYTSQTCF